MPPATYRQQLRVAEVCKAAGDLPGCERALEKFLSQTMPTADTLYQAGLRDVYTDIATAATELIHLLHNREEIHGARAESERLVAFFAGETFRLERVEVRTRAAMMFSVATHSPAPELRANLFGAAGLDFAQAAMLPESAQARVNESLALFELQNFRKSHEQALLAARVARQAGRIDIELQAVEQLSKSFLTAGDSSSAIGILQEFLQRDELSSTDHNATRMRAEVTESLARRYLAINNRLAARDASKRAASLYTQCGDHFRAAQAWELA